MQQAMVLEVKKIQTLILIGVGPSNHQVQKCSTSKNKIDIRVCQNHANIQQALFLNQIECHLFNCLKLLEYCLLRIDWQDFDQIYQKIMDDDLKRGLLNKKVGFDRYYEEALLKVAKIRQKNDGFQKHSGPDVDEEVKDQIHSQSKFIQKEINELKELLNKLENTYRDPESKNKIKQLKGDAQKQIQRNRIILKDIINRSFVKSSGGKENIQENQVLIEGGKVNYEHMNGTNKKPKMDSMLTDSQQEEQQQIQIDYQIERKILLQKNALLNEVEQSTMKINEIMNDMAIEVQQQGNNLDVISQELMTANKNMTDANKEIEQASQLQKKSKRKYICLVIIILIVIAAVVGVVVILKS